MDSSLPWFIRLAVLAALLCVSTLGEQHRATRLGNPATRFAPPLSAPDDLRSRFRDEKLKPDFASVLRQWGWRGNVEDLFRAALSAEISDIKIPVGTVMPFMSSRENGKAICLRNVLWAGKEPAPAYAFDFTSKGRRYRCITPKACSNFFVVDRGAEPKAELTLNCTAPAEILAGRPLEVCLSLRNGGDGPAAATTATLTLPEGVRVVRTTEDGIAEPGRVTWNISSLAPAATRQVCATLGMRQPASLEFTASAANNGRSVQSSCATRVLGVPAILLEVVDMEDPVEVGKEIIYEIRVTNQGTAPGTNIRVACMLPGSEEFVSGGGPTSVHAQGRHLTTDPLPKLDAKSEATWRLVVKALKADDARFRAELSSDQFATPIEETEATQLY